MGLTYISAQHAFKDTSGTSTTISFPGGTTAGDLLICGIRVGGTSTAAVTDGTNTWNIDISLSHAAFGFCYINSAPNAAPVTTLTITLTGGSTTMRITIAEFSGAAISALDKTSSLYTASGTTPNSGNTATTSQADELLIGFIGSNTALTYTAGTSQAYALTDVAPAAPNSRAAMEYVIVSATGAYQADFTTSNGSQDYITLIATYKAAAGGSISIGSIKATHTVLGGIN